MVRLEFPFGCKEIAFNFRVGSKFCACKTNPTTQEAPSAKQNCSNDATQTSDPPIFRSSGLSHLKNDETSGLPLSKSNFESPIDPLLLKSLGLSNVTNDRIPELLPSENPSEARIIVNADARLGNKPSQSPPSRL